MFKKRTYKLNKNLKRPVIGNISFYTLKRVRYELVYLRVLKKHIRQKHIRKKIRFFKNKFWFFLKPNYILTAKPTNARMGAGTGTLVRVSIRINSYFNFVCLKGYSSMWACSVYKKIRYKYSFKFLINYR